ncbi:MAG: TetR family transcriptional regulator [Pseudomonadota bacterium]
MDSATDIRKKPTQERSKQRVRKILTCAADRISEVGADQLKMSDIARMAEVPIGSIYQYFPNKASIIRSLAESHLEKLRGVLLDNMSQIGRAGEEDELDTIRAVSDHIIDTYYDFYRNEPAFTALWGGLQADNMLMQLEVSDTLETAELFYDMFKPMFPPMPESRARALSLVICNQTGATLRFALQLDDNQAKELIEAYKEQLFRLAQSLLRERDGG